MTKGHPHRVVFVVYDEMLLTDLSGPADVLSSASRLAGEANPGYASEVVGVRGAPVRSSSGVTVAPDLSLEACRGQIGTLVVVGGGGSFAAAEDPLLVHWLRDAAGRSERVASVCSGALILGAAGLLEGRRATTHWSTCAHLANAHPATQVVPDAIHIRDGDVWTSAGATAGIDLALAIVEEDHGPDLAREVARWLVVFLQRPGGQSQFSSALAGTPAAREPLRDLQGWIADNLDADLRVEALAERVHMSPRNFARSFSREIGLTPAAYVEAVRVERAKQRLEQAGEPVEAVARGCGFGTAETMRRAFARRVGVAPADYRARFRRPPTRQGATR